MKNKLLLFIVLAIAFSSCDPGATTTVYFENDTDLEVGFQAFGSLKVYSDPVSFEKLTVGPHSRVEVGILYSLNECLKDDASWLLSTRTDSIRITFIDCSLIYYRDSVDVQQHSPYSSESFHLENYKSDWNSDAADAVYVITEDDYHRAK